MTNYNPIAHQHILIFKPPPPQPNSIACLLFNRSAFLVVIAVMFTYVSVLHGDWSGWGFMARIKWKVIAEQREAYWSTTSRMKMEMVTITAALRYLSGDQWHQSNHYNQFLSVPHCPKQQYLAWMGIKQRQLPPTGYYTDILSVSCWSGRHWMSRSFGCDCSSRGNNHDGQNRHCEDHTQTMVVDDTTTVETAWSRMTGFEIRSGFSRKGHMSGQIHHI